MSHACFHPLAQLPRIVPPCAQTSSQRLPCPNAPALCLKHLETHPHLIDEWAVYSNDKRCSSGWYFDDSRYSTGHFSSAAGRTREQVFSERPRACAEFIKHELDSILENVA
jgi:hypothetical protein